MKYRPEINVLHALPVLNFDIGCDLYDCDALYWSDGDHWSPEGETRIASAVEATMPPLLREASYAPGIR